MNITQIFLLIVLAISTGCTSESVQVSQPNTEQETGASPSTMLAGASFASVDQSVTDQNANADIALSNDRISFTDNTVTWANNDVIEVGSYSQGEGLTLLALFSEREVIFEVDGDNLIWDSVEYLRVRQFTSQETLVSFLNNASYKSVDLKPTTQINDLGAMGNGLSYWFVDFLDNTITWAYQGNSQVGTVEYLDDNSFTALFPDITYTVNVENNEITFDGTRYSRVIGE